MLGVRRVISTIVTMAESYPDHDIEVTRVERRTNASLVRRLLAESRHHDAVIVFGAVGFRDAYSDLIAAAILGKRGHTVIVTECIWEPTSRSFERLLGFRPQTSHDRSPPQRPAFRAAVKLIDAPSVHYCVESTHELRLFPTVWGVDPSRVHFTPFCYWIDDTKPSVVADGTVFAGGDSLRDYRALLAAASSVDAKFVVATHLPLAMVPANVKAGPLPSREFDAAFRAAAVVVVPLVEDSLRAAGQQTYLSAMALGKPLVVTDSPGVRDYVRNGETGLIVQLDEPAEMAQAIRWLLDPSNAPEVAAMTGRAQAIARANYGREAYFGRLFELVNELSGAA
jgi:glycosyltransferase involved in cell wall biosynthesis